MINTEIWRIQILDWLYDFRPDRSGEYATIVDFLSEDQRSDDHLHELFFSILQRLSDEDLIDFAPGMGFDGLAASITSAGRTDVEARRERRRDLARRNAAARDASVRWIYQHPRSPDPYDMLTDQSAYYEGRPFDRGDLDAALRCRSSTALRTAPALSRSAPSW